MAKAAAGIIDAYNAGREAERLALKMQAMRSNVFSFYRGTAHLFWQRAAEAKIDAAAPPAWCCGDLHLENFGTYLGDNGLAYFDLNDFDEAAKAPCDWELLRLVASIAVAAPSFAIGSAEVKALMTAAAEAYREALARGKAFWIERRTASGAIGELIDGLKSRDRQRLLDRRTTKAKGRRTLVTDGKHALPATSDDLGRLRAFCEAYAKTEPNAGFYTFVDGARRIAGTGSLGLARFVILVEGDGAPDGNVLLDLKAATPSSLADRLRLKQPPWATQAERVVTTQHRCQAIAPHLLNAVDFGGASCVLKELQPSADRLDLGRIARGKGGLTEVVRTMAQLAAWAQIRAAGRGGAATPDDLEAFASDAKWTDRLCEAAHTLVSTTLDDYKDYCRAYDGKAGGIAPVAKKR